jgi:membrane protein DedA with SNARE-associated domain
MPDEMLRQLANPWLIALGLILTSYWLEDVAIAAGVASATQGNLSWAAAFGAVVVGIASGDVLLYLLGTAAQRVGWLQRRLLKHGSAQTWHKQLDTQLLSALLLARVIPGLRFVTYSACGFLSVSLPLFCTWILLAVLIWTAGLFALSAFGGQALADSLGIPLVMAVVVPIALLAVGSAVWRKLQKTILNCNAWIKLNLTKVCPFWTHRGPH